MQLAVFNAVIATLGSTHEVTHFNIEGRPYDVGTKGRYTWAIGVLGQPTLMKFTDNSTNTVIYTEVGYVYEMDVKPIPIPV